MEERNLMVFLKHTQQQFIFVKKLLQCDICKYCCFQVVIKTHEKQTWRRETSQFFLKHSFAVHFVKKMFQCDICHYCCFQVNIKTHAKQTWRRKTVQVMDVTFSQIQGQLHMNGNPRNLINYLNRSDLHQGKTQPWEKIRCYLCNGRQNLPPSPWF